jgi:DMSO/TMAO reductase YedYZ molybdopterin-dependent catalytic subunit
MNAYRAYGRRDFLKHAGWAGAASLLGGHGLTALADAARIRLPFDNGERELAAFPQKRQMIVLTSRPPQLETPFAVFNDGVLTPNDAFFVRYHWSAIPTSIDPGAYRVKVGGHVNTPLELSLAELKQMGGVDLVAVNQCSGNSRAYFAPRANGGQLSNGAMGNARWTGVPLKAVLEKAGVKAGAVQVAFNGLDTPPAGDGPDFVKALNIDHALDGEVMLAWQMNGEDLPMLNGAGLLRHLLDQTPVRHHRAGQAFRWLLDGHCLPHPGQCLRLCPARHRASPHRAHRPLQCAFLHHQRGGRCARQGGSITGGQGHCLRRRPGRQRGRILR